MKARFAAAAIASALTLAGTASAQSAAPSRASEAESLFREGRTLLAAGELAPACAKFAESEKLDPAPGTLLSLADCEERTMSFLKAREHYQLAASGFLKTDPRRAFAAGRAQALDGRLAHVVLRLPPDAPPETNVRLGGVVVPRSELGTSTAIDPGELHVKVSAPGHKDNTLTIAFAEGETKDVACDLGPAGASLASDADAGAGLASTQRTVAFVLLGVGAASIVVGGVAGVLAISKANTVKDHCDASYQCDQVGLDAAESGRLLSPVSTITLVAGAAVAAAGVYFYFASSRAQSGPRTALLETLRLRWSF